MADPFRSTLNWSHDIIDAIARFRVAFLRENMKPPTVIILPDHEEGMRLLSYLRDTSTWSVAIGSPLLGIPIESADGTAYMEIDIVGMKVRWPANKYAMPDGSWKYA